MSFIVSVNSQKTMDSLRRSSYYSVNSNETDSSLAESCSLDNRWSCTCSDCCDVACVSELTSLHKLSITETQQNSGSIGAFKYEEGFF